MNILFYEFINLLTNCTSCWKNVHCPVNHKAQNASNFTAMKQSDIIAQPKKFRPSKSKIYPMMVSIINK